MLGAVAEGYDPTRDAISELAALGAPTRPAMTAGLLALGAGMTLYGLALPPGRARWLPMANGATALAVAALPLGGGYDGAHGLAAGLGYATLAAIPVSGAWTAGSPPGGRPVSVLTGMACGLCLLATELVSSDGLLQRLGLGIGHAWVVFSALGLLGAPTWWSRTRGARAPAGRRR